MLSSETKRKIDSARDVLVGKVPDPKAQVEQITNALIYKFMDDMDKGAIEIGGKARFFTNGYEKYAWTKLMDTKLGGHERLNLYAEALAQLSLNPHIPQLFRDIFKDAFLPYRDPETLSLFLKEINGFTYEHSEDLGDAFEYLLSVLGSQGDAGQFRTPRHIIDFIVAVVDPKKDDVICDPACGTAGFLISAYKHILAQNHNKPLTPDEKKQLMERFTGYDISPDMVKLSKVNMYLHGFPEPKIYEYDTLSSEERWDDSFDVMLANPPFMTPKGGVRPHKRFSVQANRSEVLFVDYILEHLRPNGRAGVIVPEGIIFQSGNAYKRLRKNLVDDGLYAVVSLPSGVFQPYSGVKTSILLFNNAIAKQRTEILFVRVENDGFDLGATKRPISKNDLPAALDILNKWKIGEKVEDGIVMFVEKIKIAESDDISLSGDRYRIATDYTNIKWPMAKLEKICNVDWGNTNLTKSSYMFNGQYLAVSATGGDGRIEHFEHEVGVTVLSAIGANCGKVFYPEERFTAIKNTITFTPDREKVFPKYLFYLLSENKFPIRGGGQPFMTKGDVQKYQIPLPPIEIQEQIVSELDGYQNVISGAKQVISNWKPKIDIDPKWEWLKVEDIAAKEKNSIKAGPFGSSLKKEIYEQDGYKVYGQEQVIRGDIEYGDYYINERTYKQLESCSVKAGDILISLVGTYGKLLLVPEIFKPGIINPRLMKITLNKGKCLPTYFKAVFESDDIKNQLISMSYGGTMGILNTTILRKLKVPVPPLDTQKIIVEKIESERVIVDANKKLIEIYEQKIKDTIAKLWAE